MCELCGPQLVVPCLCSSGDGITAPRGEAEWQQGWRGTGMLAQPIWHSCHYAHAVLASLPPCPAPTPAGCSCVGGQHRLNCLTQVTWGHSSLVDNRGILA